MSADAVWFLCRRPFQTREFLEQSWFIARVRSARKRHRHRCAGSASNPVARHHAPLEPHPGVWQAKVAVSRVGYLNEWER